MVHAFRSRGHRIGFYHSLIDWRHPRFPTNHLHSGRDDEDLDAQNEHRDIARYRDYLHGQTAELLTEFGKVDDKVDRMWFDFSYPGH